MTPAPTCRVAVTGIGAVSAFGWGADALWAGLCSGATRIGSFRRFVNDAYPTHLAGEVEDRPIPGSDRLSFADRFAVGATLEALRQSGLPEDLESSRAGVYFGSSTGGMFECEEWYAGLAGRSLDRVGLRPLATQQVASPGEAVARRVRATGPVETVSSACASATLAIENGLQALRDGIVDVAIVGGADSLCRVTYAGFNALQSVDARPSRPFREDRRGLSLGEGGAVLVLERAADAQRRGATRLAEMCGAGCSADAHHMTAPHPEGAGAALALRRALADGSVEADDVDLVNAHGTGTELNDRAEFGALCTVFGQRARTLPIVCPKASVGHLLGSAGAIEAVTTVQILQSQTLPPTPGGGTVDPRTPVSVLRSEPVHAELNVGISLNLAFGGCNGALVFRRWGVG